jgi:2,4-dienoyl-CoA reductase-like NADH-dependent reductase (Old Yellow Enzyme family)
MSNNKSILFDPISAGSLNLSNRIVMAPMTRNFSPGGIPGDDVVAYYGRRAETGVGLIITEGTTVNHPGSNGYPGVPRFFGDDALQGWARVVTEVHKYHGKIIPQLWHVGYIRKKGIEPDPAVPGYSAMQIEKNGEIEAIAMDQQEIDAVVQAFAQAARDAEKIGFDGIEIHGAHEYLIDQFLWEGSNQRTDKYGGSLENRLNFALEIVKAARSSVSKDFPIVFRFSQWKQQDYKAKLAETPAELEKLLLPLSEAGADIFHASTRRFWEPEFEGSPLNLAGWSKKITGKPSITVGSVGLDSTFTASFGGKTANPTGLENLYERLEKSEFDMVAVGRALLADAEWITKIKSGHFDKIQAFDAEALKTLS